MTVGVTHALSIGARVVACASTGNTSASMASYAARAGLHAVVFIPDGAVALGKLSQSIAYGALTVQIRGDFDAAMRLVTELTRDGGIYLLNSLNPYRLEGQKTIVLEALQQMEWETPDWIVLPGGNLGNTSAFGKALWEARELGLIARLPRLAVVQAAGANPLYLAFRSGFREFRPVEAKTIATAIKIGDPVSYRKAKRALEWTDGVVEEVSDVEILDAKAQIDAAGIGCEPASAASVAGLRRLVESGTVGRGETAVAILTGHLLKDPDTTIGYHLGGERAPGAFANRMVVVEPRLEDVLRVLQVGVLPS
jgi:threonine synthase